MAEPVLELINIWPEPQQTIGKPVREMILGLEAGLMEDLKWNAASIILRKTSAASCAKKTM